MASSAKSSRAASQPPFRRNQVRESTLHPQTEACVDYIMKGTGSFVECGFTRIE